jgi:hypothetical protein
MSAGGRAGTRSRFLRRVALGAAVFVLLALVFFGSGHWLLGIVFAAAAVGAVWLYLQARSVR